MSKREFLDELKTCLEEAGIAFAQDLTDFYDEIICECIDTGMREEEAVARMESVDEIIRHVQPDMR